MKPKFKTKLTKTLYTVFKWFYLICLIAYLPAVVGISYFANQYLDTAQYAEGFLALFLLLLYVSFPIFLAFMVLGQFIRQLALICTKSLSPRSAIIGTVLRILSVAFAVLTFVALILWFLVGIFLNTELLYFVLYIIFALIAVVLAFWK